MSWERPEPAAPSLATRCSVRVRVGGAKIKRAEWHIKGAAWKKGKAKTQRAGFGMIGLASLARTQKCVSASYV